MESKTESLNEELTTEQIAKIKYDYNYLQNEQQDEKFEYSLSEDLINMLDFNNSDLASDQRTQLKSISSGMVGVIMESTCGSYRKIKVKYDCEDRHNSTNAKNYVGGWQEDPNHNLIMYFCEVPYSKFGNIGQDYAVLRLSTDNLYPKGFDQGITKLTHISINMDAEDHNPYGYVQVFNSDGTEISNNKIDEFLPNKFWSTKNLQLEFIYFPKSDPITQKLPDLGFNYAVFGTLTGYGAKGEFYSDDEDSSNSNSRWVKTIDKYGNEVNTRLKEGSTFNGIIWQGNNTTFYFTQRKTIN